MKVETCPFDDVPGYLCLSYNCKAVHVLSNSNKTDKDTIIERELVQYRKSRGFSISNLSRSINVGSAVINAIEGGQWEITNLKTIFKLYSFYGGRICLKFKGKNQPIKQFTKKAKWVRDSNLKNRKEKLKALFKKYHDLCIEHGNEKAAKIILKKIFNYESRI